ncbi:hypothetical protein ABZZ79_39060 [Streptomyces sp. NPDC006458]|uniref:hypothetical protein n=1 Tax=Streptomyces sp. NPDC006458 TaxID=3154302 RepID=UPI0033A6F169
MGGRTVFTPHRREITTYGWSIGASYGHRADVCAEGGYRNIVLQQGPIALGWQRWRELDHLHLGGLVLDIVNAALDAGRLRPHPPTWSPGRSTARSPSCPSRSRRQASRSRPAPRRLNSSAIS